MSVFLQQFRLLLGIPDVSTEEETIPIHHIRLWEKDSLLRERTIDQLTSAKLTLQVIFTHSEKNCTKVLVQNLKAKIIIYF